MKFECPLVVIDKIEKLPNSDTLSVTTVFGEIPVIIRTGQLVEGSMAVYIPEEAMVPMTKPQFQGLGIKTDKEIYRVKAVRLRGTYSEGLLVPLDHHRYPHKEGDCMAAEWGITHYVEPETNSGLNGKQGTQRAKDLPWAPKYSVESILKNRDAIPEGEMVQVTEKLHGCNGRYVYDGVLHVGSHNVWKKPIIKGSNIKLKQFANKMASLFGFSKPFDLTPVNDDVWWSAAKELGLADKLKNYPKYVFYGEIYGKVQDLKYGVDGVKFRVFDIYNANTKEWESPQTVEYLCSLLDLPVVPVLYSGPYHKDTVDVMRSGKSILHSGTIREGIVIKLLDNKGRNSALKYVSEEYKLRKSGTEFK